MIKLTIGKLNAALFLFLIVTFGVVMFYPVNPLEIRGVQVHGNTFKAGGELSFTVDRCKNVDDAVNGTASRYFVNVKDSDKPDIFISSTDNLGQKGCGKVTRSMDIPAHIKDGDYKLKFVTRYFPSILREPITIEYTTEQVFHVKGQELSAQLQNILAQLQSLDLSSNETNTITPSQSDQRANAAPQAPVTPAPVVNPQPSPEQEQNKSLLDNIIDATQKLLGGL